ncbi:PREDICTED: caffeoylshikimate esterase-like [Camelina sativa]|uniref:Caffeoylshikimate esterase-like n=1 Tax=Camelina sativa TaxID=90675 RepID=A0ABM0VWL2_CAMSA|nr:PREDICTED: caffeoylshikimate esterase-like [Camelina sativa]
MSSSSPQTNPKIKKKTKQKRTIKTMNSAPTTPPAPPPNFWGDMPEEEYYTSQGVRNTKSYFETPNGKLFTQSFLPLDGKIKGTVYMSHGYGSDTGWMFQKICMRFCSWGYAAFAADILGHGRSDGIRCYMGDMDKVAGASLAFFKHVRCSDPYKDLPAFLFGESMGGLVTILMYFQSEPGTWTGLIFSAPLFVIPEDMKPSKPHLFAYSLLFGLADTWAAMPDKKMVGMSVKDPEKLKIIAANPRRYTGPPRVGTMRELLRKTEYVQENFGRVTIPVFTAHGTSDGVTCPTSSKLLYEKASSADKTLKIYEGMYHSLIQGETDENAEIVLKDMREWIDERVKRYGLKTA